jgi:hypothetical protein
MLDFPAAASALWGITAATGIKPEWLLPILSHESGFNPAVPNQAGAPYYGIGQNGTADIATYAGVTPDVYLTWTASQQLSTVVKGYLSAAVHSYGPLRSGVRVYQAEYLPATLPIAKKLTDTIASASDDPHGFYRANAGLDTNHDGAITLGDLASIVTAEARKQTVQQAIRDTYAARDTATVTSSSPTDINEIVYGDDFSVLQQNPFLKSLLIGAGIVAVGGGVIYAIETHKLDRFILPKRNRRRR